MVTNMASHHSSPSDMSFQPKNSHSRPSPLSTSPNTTTPPNNKKKWQAKDRWTTSEEAALVTVLSYQKRIGNSSESRFKGSMWRMVEVAVRPIGEGPSKSAKQHKAQYQWVSCCLPILSFH